ncbi:MAG: hypothetical protein ABIH11_08435 [Candidatus Altiarchaeota archaeon]
MPGLVSERWLNRVVIVSPPLALLASIIAVSAEPGAVFWRVTAFFSATLIILFAFWTLRGRSIIQELTSSYRALRHVLFMFLLTRFILTLIGVSSRMLLKPFYQGFYWRSWFFSDHLWLDIWGIWDSEWYMHVAKNWYSTEIVKHGASNYGFFPLYPLLMRSLGMIVGDYFVAGVIISNISLIAAGLLLYRLVLLDDDEDAATRSVNYMFLFPSAFILSGVFTEALFLALLISCFYNARRGMWFYAGISGFFMALTRPQGVIVFIPLLYEYLRQPNLKVNWNILNLLMIPAGLATFLAYSYYQSGDYLAYAHSKTAGWGLGMNNPVKLMYDGLSHSDLAISVNCLVAVLLVLAFIPSIRKLRFSYWTLGVILLVISTIPGYASIKGVLRFTLAVFPFYIFLGKASSNPRVNQALTISLAMTQGFLMVLWTIGSHIIT